VEASVEVEAGGEDVDTERGVVDTVLAGVVGEEPLLWALEPVVVAVGLVTGLMATT
jgi:hypothetical protein